MSNIIAPPAPSYPFYLGKGIQGATGSLNIFGYTIPNDLSYDVNGLIGAPPWSILDSTTLFDVSSLEINHEVVVALYAPTGANITGAVQLKAEWYRKRDGYLCFETYFTISAPATGTSRTTLAYASWIGYASEESFGVDEISENGQYAVILSATGGTSFTQTIDFNVIGIPPSLSIRNINGTYFDWIVRTSNYFDSSNYTRVGLSTNRVAFGSSSPPANILGYVNAPSSNNGCAGVGECNITTSGSYTLYGFAQANNGLYYPCGEGVSVTMEGADDHGDTMATATTIPLNTSILGSINFNNDADFFKFRSTVAGEYSIYSMIYGNGTNNTDTKGYLYDSSGIQLAYNDDNVGSNFGFKYSLPANTIYYVKVTGFGTNTRGKYYVRVDAPTTLTGWDWNASTARQIAYTALTNKGNVTNFSYLVWNDLVSKIHEAAQVKGFSWDEYYATLADTKMSSTDKAMTAKRFNSAKYNIGVHYSTGIPDVSVGSTMLGSQFTSLATKLNSWIST